MRERRVGIVQYFLRRSQPQVLLTIWSSGLTICGLLDKLDIVRKKMLLFKGANLNALVNILGQSWSQALASEASEALSSSKCPTVDEVTFRSDAKYANERGMC